VKFDPAGQEGENAGVKIHKLASTDGFIVFDLDDADQAAGVVRLAPKVLTDGAGWLARSFTYRFASFGLQVGGASAGINAKGDDRSAAIRAFIDEVGPMVKEGRLLLEPGKGLGLADLEALVNADPRGSAYFENRDRFLAAGVVASAEHAMGGSLQGKTVALEGAEVAGQELLEQLGRAGAQVVAETPSTSTGDVIAAEADVLVVGSKAGVIDHVNASGIQASVVVPWGAIPVTAKALAALRRKEVVVLPDFVTTAGPSIAPLDQPPEVAAAAVRAAVTSVLEECRYHPAGPLLGACERAEQFLRTWRDELPFGRPLA
jgi:glutamate dehydrogenase/leucine dehydrogenase